MKTHPVLGAVTGFFFGVFVTLDLILLGVIRIDTVVIYLVPVLGLLLGIALGAWAPFRRNRPA